MSAIHCFFCGGKDCKWENWKLWADKNKTNAIDGLYSNWITDNILAMQRPSTRLINQFNLTEKFRELGIGSIFNLEEFGEHASCGDGIELSSGFSYLPETWMDAGVFYYNFGWQDMNVPDFSHMLSIAQVMAYALEEGHKIAVHCHAGLGRTGLAIACYLVYGLNMNGNKAIELVRTQRPLSVQTRKQALFVLQFEEYIKPFKVYFPGICSRSATEYSAVELLPMEVFLQNQRRYFHGSEQRNLLYVPKIVAVIVERLKSWIKAGSVPCALVAETFKAFEGIYGMTDVLIDLQAEINAANWELIRNYSDPKPVIQLLLYWIISLEKPLISDEQLQVLGDDIDHKEVLKKMDKGTLYTCNSILDIFREGELSTETLQPVFEKLSVLFTRHRVSIEHPYKPQLLYAKDIIPPLPPRLKGSHSRSSSNRPDGIKGKSRSNETLNVSASISAEAAEDLIALRRETLTPISAVLRLIFDTCKCGTDGRPLPISEDVEIPTPPDEEPTREQDIQAAVAAMNNIASQPPSLRSIPSALALEPLRQVNLAKPGRPISYWANVLILMDSLLDAGVFTSEAATSLRRLCMLQNDALEIAYEAYGKQPETDDRELKVKYARFIRAVNDLVGIEDQILNEA